jgi:septal ring factor EnvC (AmiA/AmiB activator)
MHRILKTKRRLAMKQLLTLVTFASLTLSALAATNPSLSAATFRSIVGDAASIQKDAEALSQDLKAKALDENKVKADITSLGTDIAKLRKDVEQIESHVGELTPQQKTDWELIKTKVQLLTIFHERKTDLMNSGDLKKNRAMLRAHAEGIAKRAQMLQQTASRLDK